MKSLVAFDCINDENLDINIINHTWNDFLIEFTNGNDKLELELNPKQLNDLKLKIEETQQMKEDLELTEECGETILKFELEQSEDIEVKDVDE